VETQDTFFVEGAWDGEFNQGRFDQAVSFYGSGGVIDNQDVIFAPPTHTRGKIVSIKIDNEFFVSNSLVFLLQKTGFELDETYEHYHDDFLSIYKGFKNYIKQIPVKPDNRINIHYYCNLAVKPDFNITELPKRQTEVEFTDFAPYKSFLDTSVGEIFRNANDPQRKIRYTPITTLSRGYDSPCCSVLAKRNGCRDALSFVNKNNPADSGAAIADRLGLNLTEVDRLGYLQSDTEFPEAEIFATGNETTGLYILSLEKYLDARILVTGFHGDTMWNKVPYDKVTSELYHGGSGDSFNEFRLRIGFIHFILPYLGATQYPAIFKMTHSPKMQKYSSEPPHYDRPIAVRIITEENIPREMFAQTKMGSGTYPYMRKRLARKILFKLIKLIGPRSIKQRIELIQLCDTYQYYLKEDSRRDLYRFWRQAPGKSLPTNNFLWGVNHTRKNYPST
jgi:hypothetical protein